MRNQYGPGDPETWGHYLGHPNDPGTPELTQAQEEALFEQAAQECKKFLEENICGELSNAGTSHGATEKVAPAFAAILAGLPDTEIIQMMNMSCWNEQDKLSAFISKLIDRAIDKAAEWEVMELTQ